MDETHIGRGWGNVPTWCEDECPCPKAACGLVIFTAVDPGCPQHAFTATKTIRSTHLASDCALTVARRALLER